MNKDANERVVTIKTIEDFETGLRELADSGREVIDRMKRKEMEHFISTNYPSAKKAMVLVHRFAAGAIGIVATSEAARHLGIDDSDQSPEVAQGKQIAAEAKEKVARTKQPKKPS